MLRGPGGYAPVPGPPVRPMEAARPAAWPGMPAPASPPAEAWPGPPAAELIPFERARMVARVGADAILVSDLMSMLDEMLEKNAEKATPEQFESIRKMYREQLLTAVQEAERGELQAERPSPEQLHRKTVLQQLLKEQVNLKLVYLDAQKKIPSENFPNVEKQFNKQFEQIELKRLMARYEADSWRDLDQALRARGTSFERVRRESFERNLFNQWLRQQVKFDEEITLEQMRTYYREHPTEFDKAARTRWQMLSVPFSKHLSKDEARDAIVRMGNQAMQGTDFTAVAKAGNSDSDGEIRDWPDQVRPPSPGGRQGHRGPARRTDEPDPRRLVGLLYRPRGRADRRLPPAVRRGAERHPRKDQEPADQRADAGLFDPPPRADARVDDPRREAGGQPRRRPARRDAVNEIARLPEETVLGWQLHCHPSSPADLMGGGSATATPTSVRVLTLPARRLRRAAAPGSAP